MSAGRKLTINIDGAARGNPGPAAWAYVIRHDGEIVLEECGKLGNTTNNVAEYTALVRALERAAELQADTLDIKSDSELLVKQMNGEYKVRNANLLPLYEEANRLRRQFKQVDLTHVYRTENKDADRLCNEALDGRAVDAGPRPRKAEIGSEKEPPPANTHTRSAGGGGWAEAKDLIRKLIEENSAGDANAVAERIVNTLQQRGFKLP